VTPSPTPQPLRLPNPEPQFSGGFIQLGNAEKTLPSDKWAKLLEEMNGKLRMQTVLVQDLFSDDKEGRHAFIKLKQGRIDLEHPHYDPDMVLADDDPTKIILDYADRHGMQIYMGLWMGDVSWPIVFNSTPEALDAFLRGASANSVAAADLAWNLYHNHASFKGWYIAYELWNFPFGDHTPASQAKAQSFKDFLATVAGKCRELNARKEVDGQARDRSVAVSAFFNPWFDEGMAGPQVTRELFTSLLVDSGIDTLILQDSVAAKCLWSEVLDTTQENMRGRIRKIVVPNYFRAFYEAVNGASTGARTIKMWDDIEAYETVSNRCPTDRPEANRPFRPTNIERLKFQFALATLDPQSDKPYADPQTGQSVAFFDKIVVFDTYHYLNTVVPDGFGTDPDNTQRLRTALFTDYKREFIDRRSQPSSRKR
jgi:hypothetical protein